jgi:MATE family multidrug resistance protein
LAIHPFLRIQRSGLLRLELGRTFRLALPLMLGELSSILMGMTGTIMIGQLGETALAAFGIAGVVFVISMLLIWGSIRMIPTPVAEAHELRDGERVRTLLFAGLLIGLFFIVIAGAVLWTGITFFHGLKQDAAVSVLATGYLKIIVFSMPALVYLAILVNFADAFGYVRFTMWISFAGLAVDVFLNWVCVFGKFGIAPMGINAIAMNTGITHLMMTLSLVWLFLRKKNLAYFRQSRTNRKAVWAQTREFIRLGVPSAMQVMVEYAAFGVGTVIIGQISKTEQAAHQIAMNLVAVTYVTNMGVSTGGMIQVGQALAYKNRAKIWLAGVATILLSILIMALPTICFLCFPETIVAVYIQDSAVMNVASGLVFFAGLFQLADCTQLASLSLLRSLNDVKIPSLFSFLAFWVVGLPLGYWLAIYEGWNARGIWMGYLVALIIQAALFLRRFFVLVDKMEFRATPP